MFTAGMCVFILFVDGTDEKRSSSNKLGKNGLKLLLVIDGNMVLSSCILSLTFNIFNELQTKFVPHQKSDKMADNMSKGKTK